MPLRAIRSRRAGSSIKVIADSAGRPAARWRCGLLRSLAVAPARRQRGPGHRLVESAEENARGTGLEALYLLSIDTEAFFARLGYERIPRQSIPEAIRALP